MSDLLERLLSGRLADIDGGPALSVPTRTVAIASSLRDREAALLAELDLGERLLVVSDPTTRAVLGSRVERALESIARVTPLVLPERPHAEAALATRIAEAAGNADAVIAVGSGTINDLCKHAGAQAGKPHAVFATAPSMNGYTSVNAAITVAGHKKSLPAQSPSGVFIDLEVLAAAPTRMIRSGLGDSLCRPTAQTDWLIAHRLLGTPYRAMPFALLAEDEAALFAEPAGLLEGDLEAMARLARTLVLSGFGMTICGGSYPASQGEHLIAHILEMTLGAAAEESFHGEQIAVTTLTMARLQERLLSGPPPRLTAPNLTQADFERRYGPETGASCWREFAKKQLDEAGAEALNARLADHWHSIAEEVAAIAVPSARLEAALLSVGGPTRPEDLGISSERYRSAVRHAREIRDRFTCLDLAADSGLLDGRRLETAPAAP